MIAEVAILTPSFQPPIQLPKRARAMSDMRAVGRAIEAYKTDYMSYPAMVPLADWVSADGLHSLAAMKGDFLPTLPVAPQAHRTMVGMTTPTAYIGGEITDVFSTPNGKHLPFVYVTFNDRWLLISCGPDEDYDLPVKVIRQDSEEVRKVLSRYTYDPTNGYVSDGDAWWSKSAEEKEELLRR